MVKVARRPAPARARWVPVASVVGVLVAAYLAFVWVRTDMLWYSSVGYRGVFTTRLASQVLLFFVFGGLMALAVAGNIVIAHRLRPRTHRVAASTILNRYRELMDVRRTLSIGAPALVLGLLAGLSGASQVETFLAWRHATSFGIKDPYFHKDVSFYVFAYPWWRYVLGSLTMVLLVSTGVAAVVHFAMGALRSISVQRGPDGQPRLLRQGRSFDHSAQAHLSILMALVMVVLGISALFDRYGYQITPNSLFTGIGYTDSHARVGAKLAVAIIAFICAAVFVANAWLRRWSIPWVALILLLVTSIILLGIYPAVVQRFTVRPSEPDRERPFIVNNIAATRQAFGVDDVSIQGYAATSTVSAGQLRADAEALPGIRLMDPSIIAPTFTQLQQVSRYYSFPGVLDVDRYTVGNEKTDAVVAAREIDSSMIPDRSWNNVHTVYTHGYGLVAAYGNRRNGDEPSFVVSDIPPNGKIKITEPRIYFGERTSEYAVVGAPTGTTPVELDTPGGEGQQGSVESRSTYQGSGGVKIGSLFTRALYATRFADLNLLLSGRVNGSSQLLYDRTPEQRIAKIAPWLHLDSDPYPAVVNGRIVWIVDGYTVSNRYPNSSQVDLANTIVDSIATSTLGASDPVNYMRNSVKATVDAYDGTVTLYAWDSTDPILQTWMKVYPGVVQPKSAIPAALLQHLRYPEDLFKVQRQVLTRYHTTDPYTWYQRSDLWQVPDDPTKAGDRTEPPYYLSIRWPGDSSAVFSLTASFVPSARQNLVAYMAVDADAASPNYGKLRVLRILESHPVAGPGQTFNAMSTNETVAAKLLPYIKQGSASAIYGNLLTIPVGGGLMYVLPVFTQTQANSGGYPALRFVVVRFGNEVGIGETLQEALDQVFKGDAGANTGEGTSSSPTTPTTPTTPSGTQSAQARQLLTEAQAAFNAADAALKKGDLGTYQSQIAIAKAKVAQALTKLPK